MSESAIRRLTPCEAAIVFDIKKMGELMAETENVVVPIELALVIAGFHLSRAVKSLNELKRGGFLEFSDGGYRVKRLPKKWEIDYRVKPPDCYPSEYTLRNLVGHYRAGVRSFCFLHLEEPPSVRFTRMTQETRENGGDGGQNMPLATGVSSVEESKEAEEAKTAAPVIVASQVIETAAVTCPTPNRPPTKRQLRVALTLANHWLAEKVTGRPLHAPLSRRIYEFSYPGGTQNRKYHKQHGLIRDYLCLQCFYLPGWPLDWGVTSEGIRYFRDLAVEPTLTREEILSLLS